MGTMEQMPILQRLTTEEVHNALPQGAIIGQPQEHIRVASKLLYSLLLARPMNVSFSHPASSWLGPV
jgi:hypothetical protein